MVTMPGLAQLRGSLIERQIREMFLEMKNNNFWNMEHSSDFIRYIERHLGESISSLYCLNRCCFPPYPPEGFVFDPNVHPDVIPLPYDSYNRATYLINKNIIAFYEEIKNDGMLAHFVGPLKPFKFIDFEEYKKQFSPKKRFLSLTIWLDLAEEIYLI